MPIYDSDNKKNKNNILTRWLYYKWSGAITLPLVLIVILVPYFMYMDSLEFYDNFTCNGLIIYKINNKVLGENPTWNNLSDEDKIKYDKILNECQQNGQWFNHKLLVTGNEKNILDNKVVAGVKGNLQSEHGDFGE